MIEPQLLALFSVGALLVLSGLFGGSTASSSRHDRDGESEAAADAVSPPASWRPVTIDLASVAFEGEVEGEAAHAAGPSVDPAILEAASRARGRKPKAKLV